MSYGGHYINGQGTKYKSILVCMGLLCVIIVRPAFNLIFFTKFGDVTCGIRASFQKLALKIGSLACKTWNKIYWSCFKTIFYTEI